MKASTPMAILCMILAALSFIYFIVIAIVGHGTNFYFIWALVAVALALLGYLFHKEIIMHLPRLVKIVISIVVSVGLLLFVIVESMIISQFWDKGETNLDYIVVLGAQLREDGPSKVLQRRLDCAYDYLVQNEHTIAIVSGGQGTNEPTTEAKGMKEYLIKKGIDKERILLEEESRNTYQNIQYSGKLFDIEKDSIGIISNNFHVFRALHIAKGSGYRNVCAIAAPSELYMLPNNMLREFLGIIKDFMKGVMA